VQNSPQICAVCGSPNQFGYQSDSFAVMRELTCQHCGAALRNSSVAQIILQSFDCSEPSLASAVAAGCLQHLKIYEVGSTGAIHDILSSLPYYVCSEQTIDQSIDGTKVVAQNLEQLSFPADEFDLVISQDVLEHVVNYHLAFQEINRVLKVGGRHIFSLPWHESISTRTRATLYQYHLLPPLYHGDYRSAHGSLVYTDFGCDLPDILRYYAFQCEIFRPHIWYESHDITNVATPEQYSSWQQESISEHHWQYNDVIFKSSKIRSLSPDQNFTGERFLPELTSPKICYEHLHRYLFATKLATGKIVLDIACGDGYGANILADFATQVYAMDIDHPQIQQAAAKYSHPNLTFRTSSVDQIPLPDHSVDLIVSFETVEHVDQSVQYQFLHEIKRVLKNDGLLVLSTPNKYQYSDIWQYHNEFHRHEFYEREFLDFLQPHFSHLSMLGQSIFESSQIWSINNLPTGSQEFLYQISPTGFSPATSPKAADYFLVIASDQPLSTQMSNSLSLFTDITHSYFLDIKNKYVTDRQQLNHVLLENQSLQQRLKDIESSSTWRLTSPLRYLFDQTKSLIRTTQINSKHQLEKISPRLPSSLKNTLRPLYHRIFSGIPSHQAPMLTLDQVNPQLVNDTYHRDTMLDIFVWPVIDWHGRWQRPQQIVSRLADRGHRIFYFSPVFCPSSRQNYSRSIKITDAGPNIHLIQLPLSTPLNIYQNRLSPDHIRQLLTAIQIIKTKFAIDHSVSIVHQPFWYPLASALPDTKLIYDCMDEHSGFSTNHTHQSELEEQLLRSADLVITSSASLQQKATKYNSQVTLIRNGSDPQYFADLPVCQESMIKKPIIGYYGAISDWFDIELVAAAARHYPDYSFVLIGHTYGADVSLLKKLSNVYLLGEKKYQDLPSYLSCFDVCLIPFKINSLTLATNPVKFYEYISSGKPVVSTALPELNLHQDICYLSRSHAEFIANIDLARHESDKAIIAKRKAIALANSWQSRVGDYEKNIFSLFPSVSIIVISYNNPDITRNCLESIYKYSRYPNFEVIVVDNASTEDTLNYLHSIEQHFPHLHIIYNRENAGFAKANNQGIKLAHGDYIIFLNNDTIVTNNWIASLVTHMESDSQIGLLGPVTNNIGNEQKIPVDYQDINSMQQFAYEYTAAHHHQLQPIKMLALFCAIARLSDLRQVDYLSEEYDVGMFEDDDLSQKFKAIGKKIIMADDIFIHHLGRASFSKLADQTYQTIFNRNRATYEKKWGPWVPHQPRKK